VDPDLGLLAVADGLGGHAAGEVASRLAISVLAEYLRDHRQPTGEQSMLDLLAGAVQAGNAAIQSKIAEEPQCQGMGTTLTACLVRDGAAYFAHIGDSRAYLLRDGQITQLSEDHTLANLRRLRRGSNEVEADPSPEGKTLLSALGTSPWVGADLFTQELQAGDLLLLCTDGLTAGVTEDELAALGPFRLSFAERCERLLTLANKRRKETWSEQRLKRGCERLLALANERGGADNITVVLALIQGSDTRLR
jgi:protein phosphatase